MAEPCPPEAMLRGFSSGGLPEAEMHPVEDHLAGCFDCARRLDAITREQLAGIGASAINPAPPATRPALVRLMETAMRGFSGSPQDSEAAVLRALDAPAQPGALGRFAGYDVLEVAGSGGMGVVLKAHDPTLHRAVALKVLSPTRAWDEESAGRFLHEARTIAAIQHDHVVAVYSAGREQGLPYLVMPFHGDGTLEQFLRHTPRLDTADVIRVGIQLGRALEVTHGLGVLHRDIKPSNVLLEAGLARVRLADFGLAQPVRSTLKDPRRLIAGTPHYMSPEQARGEAIDTRSDLFGLGALLHHLATGRTVYEGKSTTEVLQAAALGKLAPVRQVNPAVPAKLAAIIDRLLAANPQERFTSATEVAAALVQLTKGAGRFRRWTKRAIAAGLAAGVLGGAVIVALDWIGRTAVVNSLLCRYTGDGYFIRGRFGTFSRLPDAVAAARARDVIEARFSNEQVIDTFRIGGKPLTIRAAAGFTPVLVATNNAQPFILADAPLTLEGLTLWRRTTRLNSTALISVENAPIHLLNCRIARSRFQGQDILVWGRLRTVAMNEPAPQQFFRALLAFQHGSEGHIQNCVFATTQAAAIGLRASTNEPTRVTIENNLIVADRTVFMRPEPETSVDLRFARNAIVTAGLLELDETEPVRGLSIAFEDCVIDHTGGALLRVNQGHGGELVAALRWSETNVLYAGGGSYVMNRRRRQLDSEDQWNSWVRLDASAHRLVDRHIFPETTVRSALTLNASDLNTAALAQYKGGSFGFASEFVGEGKAYDAFRQSDRYDDWRSAVRARAVAWGQQTALRRTNAPTVAAER